MKKFFKKPDLKAPRYRTKRLNLLNKSFCDDFRAAHPNIDITDDEIKTIVSTFNGNIWQTAVSNRDGVELPEFLGNLFVGACPRKKDNVDYKKSADLGAKVQHRNWESDDYIAKIFYTNQESSSKFKFHDLWGFKGTRNFTRTVAKEFPKNWRRFIQVDNMLKVSRLFRLQKYMDRKAQEREELLESYNEFEL